MPQVSLARVKERVFGPPVPRDVLAKHRVRFLAPTVMLGVAALLILTSLFFPYWKMNLKAPQYPKGLEMTVYVNRVEGDVREVDGLNHYIGMRPISEAAQFERSVALIAIAALVLLVVAAVFVHNPCALLLTWPVMMYPAVFLMDLYLWMRAFGQDLDPSAPLSNIIDPFVPKIIGQGKVAQFETFSTWESGIWLAFAASAAIAVGLFLHRRAYKPVLDEYRASQAASRRAGA